MGCKLHLYADACVFSCLCVYVCACMRIEYILWKRCCALKILQLLLIKLILAQQIHCNCLDTNLRRGGKVDGVFHQFVVTVVQICGGYGGKDGDAHWCQLGEKSAQLETKPHNYQAVPTKH